MDTSQLATQIVIGLSVLLVLWYPFGRQMNRRRGLQALRWLREGIRAFEGQAAVNWVGASAFRVDVQGALGPFKKVGMMVLLEAREVLLLWISNRLRGQRDILVIRGDLRRKPKIDLELMRRGWRAGRAMKALEKEGWTVDTLNGMFIALKRDEEIASRLASTPSEAAGLVRLSLKKRSPHLIANFHLTGLEGMTAESLFHFLEKVMEITS
ncbi:MAG TPA: hypothetical protein DCP08_03050 [Chloroflexi bacterium]|nr:hypothetical protein [Chloroflexota bacterium]